MRKVLITILLSLGLTAQAQQWWTGWSQQTGLVLCLHQTDGGYELYSPLQTSDPIPVSKWSLRNDTLRLECASIGFKATLKQQDTLWVGNWRQGIIKEAITLHPADTLFQLRRPQTPQPPYHFDEETLATDYVDSNGDTIHLEGTLSYPKGGGKFPTIVLVSGSGQQNRDEEIMQHRPFLVLADYLASRGIAVLRYDDRGVGASTGPVDSADTYLLAEDAEAMFNALKGNPHVDPHRLGIGGHSEGGAIAPMVAARKSAGANNDLPVRFVVMLAGQGCTGLDVLLQQNDALYRATGLSDSLLTIRNACVRELFALPAGTPQKDYQDLINRYTAGLSKTQIDSLDLGRGAAYQFKKQIDLPWMQSFLKLDPADYLPKVECPILALNGCKDCQVLCEPNLNRIEELTQGRAAYMQLRWLNHLFQHCTTGSPDEYMMIEETFDPYTMMTIADWILLLR